MADAAQVVEEFFDAWTSKDFERARSLLHDDVSFEYGRRGAHRWKNRPRSSSHPLGNQITTETAYSPGNDQADHLRLRLDGAGDRRRVDRRVPEPWPGGPWSGSN